ncbi:MAG: hypothetical protein EU544_00100 [Promethearchaeota archaeon]|nr:MAG: hypothetical protein EU544_00100 [Candidatus Lokiarchaeota archaeon]
MTDINYDDLISQLKEELNTECAIANRYGIVLASYINEFNKGKVIPQKILELIDSRIAVANDLNIDQINSLALAAKENNYLFTFSEELILISKLSLDVNLGKLMPVISAFIQKLSKSSKEAQFDKFSKFDFSKEIGKIESALDKERPHENKFSIIKEMVNYISKV